VQTPVQIPETGSALGWQDVEVLERRLHVRRSFVRCEMGEPKSRAGRRTIGYGPRTADVLDEQFRASLYRSPESLVFCHPTLGTPLDPSKVSGYTRKAITAAGIERAIRPGHDLRHTALTHDAAAGNPAVYVQARAGHDQATMTERYVHAAQVAFPGAAERLRAGCSAESRLSYRDRVGLTPNMEDRSMSIVVRLSPANLTGEKYDEAVRRHEDAGVALPPDGMEYHVCFGTEGSLRVSEIWDSREQLEAYGERLMPILTDVGIEFAGDPEILEVHNIIRR
jgi:hypothetical protein